ncbi:MAG: hypothetical protein QF921_04250 [Pseudomonadales bacterium]|jgi:hypothetical protein|nr:hypothetical protein [Pseudomonadales bacterium]MDP6471072.1 hypothetical protein [Pseudomonadales bacterium]MDP6825742.1 hypothetical protein [Pseudomonadales bacterium]MDP6970713.1 hypothetical protein [Pseudomonadales bacterium]|tara:strand:+ start:495 stop:1151 length:657 start_codon:yes stop_codon:yes gene_type:complete
MSDLRPHQLRTNYSKAAPVSKRPRSWLVTHAAAELATCQVINLGAPIGGSIARTGILTAYRSGNPSADGVSMAGPFPEAMHEPPPAIPSTAIYSRTDGKVPWQMAMEFDRRLTDNIEVYASHMGLGVNPTVLYAVADRLAQPRNHWKPFHRSGWKLAAPGPATAHGANIGSKRSSTTDRASVPARLPHSAVTTTWLSRPHQVTMSRKNSKLLQDCQFG